MKWSIKLGTVAGIGIYPHWTFALLVGWIFLLYLGQGGDVARAIRGLSRLAFASGL